MRKAVIIVAGGSGSRMKSDIPKQFLLLKGEPILMHTIRAFHNFDDEIKVVLVLPSTQVSYWQQLCIDHSFKIEHTITEGGNTRFHSVQNGLKEISEPCLVGVHDGVRPLVSSGTLERCYAAAEINGNAIPVTDAIESIREIQNSTSVAVDRSVYKMVQTPQVFTSEILQEAYKQGFSELFTDDASVVEKLGKQIHLVDGNRENIKVTTPMDLKIGECLL
ncbi:2-C-methyl-D-erythritol 4-phosphate cytidylyltransferase [Saccharicrinis aurantiacus]|uniref:2-C-methyl-D-erythritol 4-phosphate cytidylyltransferase n=1 Tax=Saccharicrinis aurantiacus TaxID=1849719 RepID=UPI00094F74B1|nr:2-C-methyl-D-erythritol 4-phosphate cytidylyltransferase [Saccharicrinis aurantiacus]